MECVLRSRRFKKCETVSFKPETLDVIECRKHNPTQSTNQWDGLTWLIVLDARLEVLASGPIAVRAFSSPREHDKNIASRFAVILGSAAGHWPGG